MTDWLAAINTYIGISQSKMMVYTLLKYIVYTTLVLININTFIYNVLFIAF